MYDGTKAKIETHIGAGAGIPGVVDTSELVEEGPVEDVVVLTAPDVEAAFVDAGNAIEHHITKLEVMIIRTAVGILGAGRGGREHIGGRGGGERGPRRLLRCCGNLSS